MSVLVPVSVCWQWAVLGMSFCPPDLRDLSVLRASLLGRRRMHACLHAPNPDLHLDTRPESANDRHKAIHGETARDPHFKSARSPPPAIPGASVCGAHGQVFPVERLDDFGGQDGFELFGIGV